MRRASLRSTNGLRWPLASDCDKVILRSQNATIDNRGRHAKYLPYAFTENGIAMLSSVLRSPIASVLS
ncbi:MAG: ORF6N domain-containing protein [Paludibacteraceae bacterium]|nr:ORF6N domain-containing protein [Paludibacteraceae bacterium]